MTGKIPNFPKAKLNSAIHKQLNRAKIKQKKVLSLVWLQYLLAMQKLAVAAEEKAKEEKRNFVNGRHVQAVSHVKSEDNTSHGCLITETNLFRDTIKFYSHVKADDRSRPVLCRKFYSHGKG